MKMETNLWTEYAQIVYEKKQNKSYYGIDIEAEKLFGETSDDECIEFIFKHFEKGKKQQAVNYFLKTDSDKEEMKKSHRAQHMVSLYLLGLAMNPLFDEKIRTKLKNNIKDMNWYDFRYTWFLTTLYHDLAMYREDLMAPSGDKCDLKGLQYSIYKHKMKNGQNFRPRFTEQSIELYRKYREEGEKADHGIAAGYIMFDELCKNYWKTIKGRKGEEIWIEELLWKEEHLDHFAYIADAVICHNVWMKYEKDEEYEKKGLNEFIVNKEKSNRLAIGEFPIQFALCLLDTIEPVKRFGKDVLKSISIEPKGNHGMVIKWDNIDEEENNFRYWKKNILEMPYWMDVNVQENEMKHEITIQW